MTSGRISMVVALLLSLALFSTPAYAQQTPPAQSAEHPAVWKIAFDRIRVRSAATFTTILDDVYVMDSDGKNERKLTASGLCHLPNWAPDGSKMLFLCLNDESALAASPDLDRPDQDLAVASPSEADALRLLKPGIKIFGEPSWLADGKAVAIENVRYSQVPRKLGANQRSLYTMALDGPALPRLFLQDVSEAQWSPDGCKIVYVAYRANKKYPAIYLANADGSSEQFLTDRSAPAFALSWSPDSRQIAFTEWRGNHRTICLLTLQPTLVRELTPRKIAAFAPRWSPDGMRLAFSAIRDTRAQIFVINADGTGLRQLTNDKKMSCDHPSWSPDGSQIVFDCHQALFSESPLFPLFSLFPSTIPRPPLSQLYLLNVNSPNVTRIQLTTLGGSNPRFSPVVGPPKLAASK